MKNIYDITVKDAELNAVNLKKYKGKTLLIVNVASYCGLTYQYEGLQNLYDKFKGDKSKLDKNSISIGNELSFSLGLKIKDKITIMSPSGVETIIGRMPKQKTFEITSIFNSGLADFDNNIALINLDTLDEFFGFDQKDRNLEIYLNDPKNIESQKQIVQKVFNQEFIFTLFWRKLSTNL